MFKDSPVSRRGVLKGAAGISGAALAGGAGLAALTGGAAAAASIDISINGSEYSGDQGLVDYVGVDMSKKIVWKNFDVPVRYIDFKHQITIEDGGDTDWHTLYEGRSGRLTDWSGKGDSKGWGGDGEFIASHGGDKADYLNGDARADVHWAVIVDPTASDYGGYDTGTPTPAEWAEKMSVDQDGNTEIRTIKWKTTLEFYTENDNGKAVQVSSDDGVPSVQGTERFNVTVTNQQSNLESNGSGSSQAG
jgi:hypothetical protein